MKTYDEAHLFVAAIRILNHKNGGAPNLEEVCELLGMSVEAGHSVCRNLKKLDIVGTMEDPFSIKLAVGNHMAIEDIDHKESEKNSIVDELEKFKAEKKSQEKEISDIQAQIAKKKEDKLSDIEAKFKKEMEKFKKENG